MDYGLITVKFALGMVCLIAQINIFGKGNLAPTSAIDQVQNYVLGGIIGGIIYNDNVTVLQFVMVLLIWTLIVFVVKFAKNNNGLIKKIVDGQPQLLIKNGKVMVENCLRTGMTADELMFRLRSDGITNLEQVKSGILEQNGQLIITKKGQTSTQFPVINDGQINFEGLELTDHDEGWLMKELAKKGYSDTYDIYLAEHINSQLVVIPYPKKSN